MIRAGNNGPICMFEQDQSVDWGNIVANTVLDVAGVSCPGAEVGDRAFFICDDPTLNAGLVPVKANVTAADTVTLTMGNLTAGAINPGALTVRIIIIKNTTLQIPTS